MRTCSATLYVQGVSCSCGRGKWGDERDDVGARNLSDGDLVRVGGVKVDVVRSDTSGDSDLRAASSVGGRKNRDVGGTHLEVLGRLHELLGHVHGEEGGGDDNVRVEEVLLGDGVRSLLVVGDDKLPSLLLAVGDESKGVLDGAEELGLLDSMLSCLVKNL
jgi:hypothetical protein